MDIRYPTVHWAYILLTSIYDLSDNIATDSKIGNCFIYIFVEFSKSSYLTKINNKQKRNKIDNPELPICQNFKQHQPKVCDQISGVSLLHVDLFRLLHNDLEPNKRTIEDAFDGIICRCTGKNSDRHDRLHTKLYHVYNNTTSQWRSKISVGEQVFGSKKQLIM